MSSSGDRAGQLAQRLAHQTRLQAHVRIAHVAFNLSARHQGGDRVDHDHIERAGAHQRLRDLQRLLAGVGLRDEQVIQVDATALGLERVEGMLGVDVGRDAAHLLGLGDDVLCQRRLTARFRAVNLNDAARGKPPMPSAMSSAIGRSGWRRSAPVVESPIFMIDPLPNWRSMVARARSIALSRSLTVVCLSCVSV